MSLNKRIRKKRVEIYNQTGTDAKLYTIMTVTSNLDGTYRGEALIDFTLGLLIRVYYNAETNGNLESVNGIKG